MGVHAFIVPIRDLKTNETLPGIEIHDCGHKVGLNGVDNGALRFRSVGIPHENLLNRFGDVSRDGKYTSSLPTINKRFAATLGELVGGRVGLAYSSVSVLKLAGTIAIRYSLLCQQFGLPKQRESHQHKLMPMLASTYAFHFATVYLVDKYSEMKKTHDEQLVADVHALSAGLKAYVTSYTAKSLSICREACGGHGYAAVNLFGILRNDHDIFQTFEGDNTVLLQQPNPVTARWESEDHLRDPKFQLDAFRYRTSRLLQSVAVRLRKHSKNLGSFGDWNRSLNHLLTLAESHIESVILAKFIDAVQRIIKDEAKFEACSKEFNCGNMTNIGYPFWGGDRIRDCGRPEFELQCHNSTYTVIEIVSRKFSISGIRQLDQTPTVVDKDIMDDGCLDRISNMAFSDSPFECASNNAKLTYVYNCTRNISSTIPSELRCERNTMPVYNGFYEVEPDDHRDLSCNSTRIDVPILQKYNSDLRHNISAAKEILKKGFDLRYNDVYAGRDCMECIDSAGKCGYRRTSHEFVCFSRPGVKFSRVGSVFWVRFGPACKNRAEKIVGRNSSLAPRTRTPLGYLGFLLTIKLINIFNYVITHLKFHNAKWWWLRRRPNLRGGYSGGSEMKKKKGEDQTFVGYSGGSEMKKKKRNGGVEELRRRRSDDGGNTQKEEEERRRN
ncbi:Acyl-coenzyme A oxidase 2 [Morus notabilis]|uniref:non-specific serine/threonine protein kinase n=1 Tax=Morus notabilis TaxID=981085 RepID=W9RYD3_9ROSA|nr:Acyl-coenzyme A oxidase 2 [Morus notabilis]